MNLAPAAALGVALLSVVSAVASAADPDRRFKSIDVFQLEYADDVQISPDGSRIVYVRVSHDIMTDRARRNLWMVNADGTNHRPLRSESKSFASPRWSPDGTRLAYVSAAEGSPQLYVRWMDTGQTALLTNLAQAPGAIAWSPDGKSIAFTQFVPSSKPPLATPPERPEGASWAPPVKVIDSVVYRADGEGFLDTGRSHVFIVSSEGGTARQLTDGDFNDDGPLSFTPDSKHVVFASNRGPDWERDPQDGEIHSVEIATGKLTQLTARDGPDNAPVVSPDGKRIAYLGFDDRLQGYQVTHLYVMDIDGGNPRVVTGQLDRDVENPRWAADGRSLYFAYMLDAPCGDAGWIGRVKLGLDYIGIDIVPSLIEANNRRVADGRLTGRFLVADITRDALPRADLILCRDCLVHLSFQNIARVTARFRESGAHFLLVTTFPEWEHNRDCEDGDWRALNMTKAPFDWPAPRELIDERCEEGDGGWRDKSLGLWRLDELPDRGRMATDV